MAKVVELVPAVQVSDDTVECLTHLLKQATAGDVTGVVFAAILKKRRYIIGTSGTARRFPTFTRGMLRAIDDEMAAAVRDHLK